MNETETKNYCGKVSKAMKYFGVDLGGKGYDYIKEAMLLIENENALSKYGTTMLYRRIAENHGSTGYAVERCIRHFVGNAYNAGTSFFTKAIGAADAKPTNSHFLKALSEYLKYNDV